MKRSPLVVPDIRVYVGFSGDFPKTSRNGRRVIRRGDLYFHEPTGTVYEARNDSPTSFEWRHIRDGGLSMHQFYALRAAGQLGGREGEYS